MGLLIELDIKDVDVLLKKFEVQYEQLEDGCFFGVLMQCFLQVLVEENIIFFMEDFFIFDMFGKELGVDGVSIFFCNQNKFFSVLYIKFLESCIKEELIVQGFLEFEDCLVEDFEDEVFVELCKWQVELKVFSVYNCIKKYDLLRLVKEEVSWQELRQWVCMVDNEVMDVFCKIMVVWQKKWILIKKEKDQVWKILKECESILKLLDGQFLFLFQVDYLVLGRGREVYFFFWVQEVLVCGCFLNGDSFQRIVVFFLRFFGLVLYSQDIGSFVGLV